MGCGPQESWKMEAERRHYDDQIKETSEKLSKRELEHVAMVNKLAMENAALKGLVMQLQNDLTEENELWRQERAKNVSMTFGHLPLPLLEDAAGVSAMKKEISPSTILQQLPLLNQTFPNAVLACCNVVGFHQLVSSMSASEAIQLTDKLHILIDRAFGSASMHIAEKSGDCCCVVSSFSTNDDRKMQDKACSSRPVSRQQDLLVRDRSIPSRQATPSHMEEGGGQLLPGAVEDSETEGRDSQRRKVVYDKPPADCAVAMAEASLKLMASTVGLSIPGKATKNQLQLRIALHMGPAHLAVSGLTQHSTGLPPDQLKHSTPVPSVSILGQTYNEALQLRDTSLALQIRVSQQFRKLLLEAQSDCVLEQCPDFPSTLGASADSALKHTYWLVGMKSSNFSLPPLERAVPLDVYQDI